MSASQQEYTDKQKKLIAECASVILQEGIELEINPKKYVFDLQQPVAIDVEHNEEGVLVGIGACQGKKCYYWTDTNIGGWIQNAKFIGHNGVSDIECLISWAIPGSYEQLIWDTMLIGHLIDSSLKSYGLKDMAKRELGIEYPDYDSIVGKHKTKCNRSACTCERTTLDKVPIPLVAAYNALDTYCTWRLYESQKRKIIQDV